MLSTMTFEMFLHFNSHVYNLNVIISHLYIYKFKQIRFLYDVKLTFESHHVREGERLFPRERIDHEKKTEVTLIHQLIDTIIKFIVLFSFFLFGKLLSGQKIKEKISQSPILKYKKHAHETEEKVTIFRVINV